MIVLKKSIDEHGNEWLDPTSLIDEFNPKSFKIYQLARCCADVLNFWTNNTPDSFGNAPYARLDGFMSGYLCGQGYELRRGETEWDIIKGKRVILRIEVPAKPQAYYEAVKDNAETLRKVFG